MVDLIVGLLVYLLVYVLGVIVAKIFYKFGGFTEDEDVISWSWIGVFVILLSLMGGKK